jgi:hypothetical protein
MWTSIALDNSSTDTAYKGLSRLFGDVDPSPSTVSLFFDLWFMRAGTHPLSITINCGEDTDAVAALSVYFPRCGTIELATDFAGINDISGPLPYLRKLNIRVKKFRPTTILAFPNAPKLEELRLSTVSVPFVQLRLGFRRQLSHAWKYATASPFRTASTSFTIFLSFSIFLSSSILAPKAIRVGRRNHPSSPFIL